MSISLASGTYEVAAILQAGGVVLLRTDTLYGIVARANNQAAVERIYRIKGRTPSKPPIVLIASYDQMFDRYDPSVLTHLRGLWPGKVSVILPSAAAPNWITRGSASVAYRIPDNSELRQLLIEAGPLIAPSANPEGLNPATDIIQAKEYFAESIDMYVDGGIVSDDTPSRLLRLVDGKLERLR